MERSYSATGIILKRSDVGEADRIITVFTKEYGKMVAIAKGCRKLTSSRAAALEPGSYSKVYLIKTKSMPILTQTQLLNDFSHAKRDLTSMRKVFEVLEILDALLSEEDEQSQVFGHALTIFEHMNAPEATHSGVVRTHLTAILQILGFADRSDIDFSKPLLGFIEEITQKKLHSYSYLTQA